MRHHFKSVAELTGNITRMTQLAVSPFGYALRPEDLIEAGEFALENPRIFRELDEAARGPAGGDGSSNGRTILELCARVCRLTGISPPGTGRGGFREELILETIRRARERLRPYKSFLLTAGSSMKAKLLGDVHSETRLLRETFIGLLRKHIDLFEPKALFYIFDAEPDEGGISVPVHAETGGDTFRFDSPSFNNFFAAPLLEDADNEYAVLEESPGVGETTPVKSGSRPFIIYCITAGGGFDETAAVLSSEGKIAEAMMVNAIGAGLAESLAEDLNLFLDDHLVPPPARRSGARFRRLSPGYGSWQLAEQEKIAALLDFNLIDVRLTEGHIMLPEKSTSGIMGLKYPAR